MARRPTRELILSTGLTLFNEEGLAEISSVDIASVMGISPGNLHYHFQGKPLIIEELYARFETEMRMVLCAPLNNPLQLEDNWVYLYIIFEEIYDFRFFYRNLGWVFEKVPELAPQFSRLLSAKQNAFDSMIATLLGRKFIEMSDAEAAALAERLTMHFTYWLAHCDLRYADMQPKALINRGVYSALIQIIPYWSEDKDAAQRLLSEFFAAQG
ncbi:TetR/AcrR family transcriptional regulator [Robiginitomaculum antarcticum]|uniref:TetR/AcrR family transcriptional regulator n=1 Tax=Robiginitomaculum antarcticum TaxID=437507 RepID=UPI0003675596|nr:TetR/AcrR family transcriptional regulator [Robiginitomaculum antarcticum]